MLAAPLRRVLLCVTAFVVGCGEAAPPPAPAPAPEEFDDPFVEEAQAATKVAQVESPLAEASPDAVVADAEGPAAEGRGEAVAEESPPAAEPARAAAKPARGSSQGSKDRSAGAEPVPKDSSSPAPEPPAPEPPAPKDMPSSTPTSAPAPTPASAPAAAPAQARFAGTFRYAGGEAQRQGLASAIEAAAQQLNALIRPIGRKRLSEANPIRERITFAVDGDRVTATFAAGRTVTGTLGGPAVAWTSDSGKPVAVAFSLVKGRLLMDFKSDDGARRSTFTLDESGAKLTMSVTVTSERLTDPLKYALSYRRV